MTDHYKQGIVLECSLKTEKDRFIIDISTDGKTARLHKSKDKETSSRILNIENLHKEKLETISIVFLNEMNINDTIKNKEWYIKYYNTNYRIEIGKINNTELTLQTVLHLIKEPKFSNTIETFFGGEKEILKNGYITIYYHGNGKMRNIEFIINNYKITWENFIKPTLTDDETGEKKQTKHTQKHPRGILSEIIDYWKETTHATEHEALTLLQEIQKIPEERLLSIVRDRYDHPDRGDMDEIRERLTQKAKE